MGRARIAIRQEKLSEFCRKHHIMKLSLFGSVLREDFREDSDIDVLVEFEPDHIPGLSFFGMEQELSEIMGRKVELHTPHFLSPYFRDQVMEEAEVQYVGA
jgi:predicted nucleotidyltransferase